MNLRSKGGGARFGVAKVAIKGEQRRARADHAKVDRDAAFFAKVLFAGIHQFAAQAGTLALGIDAKEAKIASVASEFNVNAPSETGGIFRQQEFSLFHVGADSFGICAIASDERLLDLEGGVDQAGERFDIGFLSEADVHPLNVLTRIRCSWHGFI